MTLSHEAIMAFVDGELVAAEEERVARIVENDSGLRAFVEQQRMLRKQLQAEFAPVLEEPLPGRLERALSRKSLEAGRGKSRRAAEGWRLSGLLDGKAGFWIPAAATGGFALAMLLMPFGGAAPITSENGTLVAHGALADALSVQLGSEQGIEAETQIGVTFQAQNGAICRTFAAGESLAGAAGIACYEAGDWRIKALISASETDDGQYQRAGAAMPAPLRESATGMMAGTPFDAAQERAARDAGWLAH